MAMNVLKGGMPSPLARLASDYLTSCKARGLSPRTEEQYSYPLNAVFLPWCEREGIDNVALLDRRALDRFTSMLLKRTTAAGQPLSKHSVHTDIRPVRLLLNWAT
jgi:hypothetical protein